jgi:hypothetical protein
MAPLPLVTQQRTASRRTASACRSGRLAQGTGWDHMLIETRGPAQSQPTSPSCRTRSRQTKPKEAGRKMRFCSLLTDQATQFGAQFFDFRTAVLLVVYLRFLTRVPGSSKYFCCRVLCRQSRQSIFQTVSRRLLLKDRSLCDGNYRYSANRLRRRPPSVNFVPFCPTATQI